MFHRIPLYIIPIWILMLSAPVNIIFFCSIWREVLSTKNPSPARQKVSTSIPLTGEVWKEEFIFWKLSHPQAPAAGKSSNLNRNKKVSLPVNKLYLLFFAQDYDMKTFYFSLIISILSFSNCLYAQSRSRIPSKKPKLIITRVVCRWGNLKVLNWTLLKD